MSNFRGHDRVTIHQVLKPTFHRESSGEARREISALIVTLISLAIFKELGLIPIEKCYDWKKIRNRKVWLWLVAALESKYGMLHPRRWVLSALEMNRHDVEHLPLQTYHHPDKLKFEVKNEYLRQLSDEDATEEEFFDVL